MEAPFSKATFSKTSSVSNNDMMIFRLNVRHDKDRFSVGDVCPEELVQLMLSKGLVVEAPVSDPVPQPEIEPAPKKRGRPKRSES